MAVTNPSLLNDGASVLGAGNPNVFWTVADVEGFQFRMTVFGKKFRIKFTNDTGGTNQPWTITVDGTPIADITVDNTQTFQSIFDVGSDGTHLVILTRKVTGSNTFLGDATELTATGTGTFGTGFPGQQVQNVNPTDDGYLVGEVRPSENAGSGYAFLRYPDESRAFRATTTSVQAFCGFLGSGTALMSLYQDGVFVSRQTFNSTGAAAIAFTWTGLSGAHEYQLTVDTATGGYGPVLYQVIVDSMVTSSYGTTRDIILFIGDSNQFAVGILGDSWQGYCATTGRALGDAVGNRGIPGIKVAGQTANLDGFASALVKPPKFIVSALGVNDWSLSPTPLGQFETDCEAYLNAVNTNFPDVAHYVLKIQISTAPNQATVDTYNAKWDLAVAAVNLPTVHYIDIAGWITIADLFDTQHLALAGHVKYAARMEALLGTSTSGASPVLLFLF